MLIVQPLINVMIGYPHERMNAEKLSAVTSVFGASETEHDLVFSAF